MKGKSNYNYNIKYFRFPHKKYRKYIKIFLIILQEILPTIIGTHPTWIPNLDLDPLVISY
jgi:hypothetical protein